MCTEFDDEKFGVETWVRVTRTGLLATDVSCREADIIFTDEQGGHATFTFSTDILRNLIPVAAALLADFHVEMAKPPDTRRVDR